MRTKAEIKILEKILTQICIENDVPIENVWVNKSFGYIENLNGKKDVDFCTTFFCGANYQVQYISGCFYPYIAKKRIQ